MTLNTELSRAVRRALFVGACATGGVGSALAQDAPAAPAEDIADTVVVTGSRLVSPNLQSISPVTALSAEEIVKTGRSTIEDVINELPQVFAAQGANVSNGADGTATVKTVPPRSTCAAWVPTARWFSSMVAVSAPAIPAAPRSLPTSTRFPPRWWNASSC
jgi:hypothetical protein